MRLLEFAHFDLKELEIHFKTEKSWEILDFCPSRNVGTLNADLDLTAMLSFFRIFRLTFIIGTKIFWIFKINTCYHYLFSYTNYV